MVNKIKKQLTIRNLLIVLLIVIFITATGKITLFFIDLHTNKKNTQSLIDEVYAVEIDKETNEEKIKIDFPKLLSINKDTVGWIRANNGKVNYPIVQTTTNTYYLDKSFEKKYNQAGAIFMDHRNRSSFEDKNVVLFGHAMLNKTMFGSLNDVWKKDFFDDKENAIIKIVDANNNISEYEIFSYYTIEKEEYYITTNFKSDDEFETFLNTIKSRSVKNFNINLTKDDRILTLSTCSGTGGTNRRKVIHARRIKKIFTN